MGKIRNTGGFGNLLVLSAVRGLDNLLARKMEGGWNWVSMDAGKQVMPGRYKVVVIGY